MRRSLPEIKRGGGGVNFFAALKKFVFLKLTQRWWSLSFLQHKFEICIIFVLKQRNLVKMMITDFLVTQIYQPQEEGKSLIIFILCWTFLLSSSYSQPHLQLLSMGESMNQEQTAPVPVVIFRSRAKRLQRHVMLLNSSSSASLSYCENKPKY